MLLQPKRQRGGPSELNRLTGNGPGKHITGRTLPHTVSIHMTEIEEEIFQIGQQLQTYLQLRHFRSKRR